MKASVVSLSCLLLATVLPNVHGYLQASGDTLMYKGQKIFLSGANIAWNCYGCDFGNGQYAQNGPQLENWLKSIGDAGGNTARIWLHIGGETTPAFDSNGYVTGPDSGGTIIDDMKKFLDVAQQHNIIVIFVLWNGAVAPKDSVMGLITVDEKLQSYIDNALTPMVKSLSYHPALGAWEIVNEPAGSWAIQSNSNPCADTSVLDGTGAGWAGSILPERSLKFINWQADAIHKADSNAAVTIGTWSSNSISDKIGKRNYFTDQCLTSIGGRSQGTVDFYQVHTYDWQGNLPSNSPFTVQSWEFGLDKPLVIGEFASVCAAGRGIEELMDYSYNNGYQGALTWQYNAGGECSDSQSTQLQGYQHVKGYSSVAVDVSK